MSTTVMEPYDAQMIDYSTDIDVHMQTTVSSPKGWPQPEAAMEDDTIDTHPTVDSKPHQQEEDVEIEMESYYEETVEYEMQDDYTGEELVDVEVYDAPRDSDPASAEPDVSLNSPTQSHSELSPSIVEQHHIVMPHAEVVEQGSLELNVSTSASRSPHALDSHPILESESIKASAEETPGLPIVLELASDVLAHQSEFDDSSVVLQTAESGVVNSASDGQILEAGAKTRADPVEGEPRGESSEDHPAADSQGQNHLHFENEEAEGQAAISGLATIDSRPIQQSADGLNALGTTPEHEFILDVPVVNDEDADPHEVSAGVFIEPPPPVLLELPSSSDQPECCLFNVPTASGSVSPLGQDSSSVQSQSRFEVLLSHRPTLYYERLSDVFEALREEERIQRLAEFAEGEMVLDAYDLQLAISEDNIYAREVTLHDLNILHDGTDFSGPLRIRLRFIMPRFIGRYHLLRDQISRLNLAEDDAEAYGEGEAHFDDVPEGSYQEEPYQENSYDERAQEEDGQTEAVEDAVESSKGVTLNSTSPDDDATDTLPPEPRSPEHHELPRDAENDAVSSAHVEGAAAAVNVEDDDGHPEADADAAVDSGTFMPEEVEYPEAEELDVVQPEAGNETEELSRGLDENHEEDVQPNPSSHSTRALSSDVSVRPPDGDHHHDEDAEQEDGADEHDLLAPNSDLTEHVTGERGDGDDLLSEGKSNGINEETKPDQDNLDLERSLAGGDVTQTPVEPSEGWEEENLEEPWDDAVDEEFALPDAEEHDAVSTESSTLSSNTASKRAYDDAGFDDVDELADETSSRVSPPGPKRTRTQ